MSPLRFIYLSFFLGVTTAFGALDHGPWDALLQRYVDSTGLVDYAGWKTSEEDRAALDQYLVALAAEPETKVPLSEAAQTATLINAYNAFTIALILEHYPVPSIREIDDPWTTVRWNLGGSMVSLDQIEHNFLRPSFGWKVHAVLVCAARSCPPLRRQAFTAENLEALCDEAFRDWLGRSDLNRFDVDNQTATLSQIFSWYGDDFRIEGQSLIETITPYAPPTAQPWLRESTSVQVEHLPYHWGLNDQSGRGENYVYGILQRLF